MINSVRLLQIGDIHLPTAAKRQRAIDDKDDTFPLGLKHVMARLPMKQVFKQIYGLIERREADALIFMGDLTDRGSIEAFEGTVRFLAHSLQIGEGREHADFPVGIVPGNHDINRDLAKEPGFDSKFRPLNAALAAEKLPALPIEMCVHLPVGTDPAIVNIVLMNSCWGCGSQTLIPQEFRGKISVAIDQAIAEGGDAELAAYYDRQLDTPAFSDEGIADLASLAKGAAKSGQLVAVAHHNLLPQRTSRIAPYTELINSGRMRQVMTQLEKPVIYLHGHIHEDPIEIVKTPGGEALVCVSAPAAEDGFNLIEIKFTRNGIPLACDIIPWRFDGAGILQDQAPISVPLIGSRVRSHGPALSKILSKILEHHTIWWSQLTEHIPPFFDSDNEGQLVEAIELLRADNTGMPPQNWMIRANL